MALPEQGQIYDGYRFMGGDPKDRSNWQQAGPIDVSSQYGNGATQLPNGDIVRYGPRGGMAVLQQGGQDPDGPGKLTEGQGKAVLYGGMMRGAERDYQQAREDGYDPASIRNQVARVAGVVPFDGDFFGRLIRDDVSDRGNQAELRWAEGNLRQLTGAAATNPEIARVAAINFDRGNDELSDQRYRTRAETYEGTRYAAGPGAKVLGEYPGMPGRVELDPNTGLPAYGNIATSVRGITGGFEIGADGRPIMPDPQAPTPGSSPDTAIDYTSVPPDQLLTLLANGGWVRQGDGEPYQVEAGSVRRAPADEQDQAVAPGVVRRDRADWTPQRAVADRRDDNPILRRIDAFGRGAADVLSFGLADEVAAFGDAAIGRGQGDSFNDRFRNNRALQRGLDRADAQDVPVSRGAGQVGGAVAGLVRAAPAVVRAGRPVGNFLRTAAAGAGTGALGAYGSAQGTAAERMPNALTGGAVGAVAGPVAGAVARPVIGGAQAFNRFAGRNIGRAGQALGIPGAERLTERATPNYLRTGLARWAERFGDDRIDERLAGFAEQQIEPTLSDLTDDAGRGVLRALATRQTPARQAAREFADNRATGLQDRISRQARRTVSDDPRTPEQIRTDITARRTAEADQSFGAVRGEMIQPERGVIEALRAPATRPAIEEAATSALNRGDSETANMLRQLVDGALDDPNGVKITVGMADRISRSLNGRAEAAQRAGNNDAASAMFSLAERLRGTARGQVPGYDEALTAFAADSRLANAADLGEQFMTMEADQFAAAVNRLSPEERQVARAAARRAIERQAGTQGAAPGVAQRLSSGREQGIRSAALLDDPARMQGAMQAERDALMAARGVSPAQGSATSANLQDAAQAAGVVDTVRDAATGNIPGLLARFGRRLMTNGYSDREAEAVVMAAIDPSRTAEVINILAERMTRREARNTVRAIQRTAAHNAGATTSRPRTEQ